MRGSWSPDRIDRTPETPGDRSPGRRPRLPRGSASIAEPSDRARPDEPGPCARTPSGLAHVGTSGAVLLLRHGSLPAVRYEGNHEGRRDIPGFPTLAPASSGAISWE